MRNNDTVQDSVQDKTHHEGKEDLQQEAPGHEAPGHEGQAPPAAVPGPPSNTFLTTPSSSQSTRSALLVVYAGYGVRYLSLLILIPYFGRVLGATGYGQVLTAMSLMGVIWMLVNYGFSPVGNRNVAGVDDRAALAAEVGRQVHGRLCLLAVALPVGAVATWASPVLRSDPLFGVLAVVVGVFSGFNFGWFFQGTRQFVLSILLEVAVFVINVVLALWLVRSAGDGVQVLVALACANGVVLLVAWRLVLRQLAGHRPMLAGAWALLRESTSLFLLGVLPSIMLVASSYLLSLFAGAQQVGHFGSAERLATALMSMLGPAHQVMLGTVSAKLKESADTAAAFALMRKGVLWLSAFGIVAMVGTLVTAPLAIRLVFGDGFEPSIRILQVLALGFPFAAFAQAASVYVLMPLHKEQSAVHVAMACAVLQALLLVVLASPYGGQGAAIARTVAEAIGAIATVVLLWKMGLAQRLLRRADPHS